MGKIKILLIDDEQDLLEVMGTRIESWGYEMLTAANGKDGIEILKSKRPDIIILDYMMPGMDGISTLKVIRKIDKKIPVVMFTAHPDIKSIEGTERMGVSAYIPKLSAYSDAQPTLKAVIEVTAKRLKRDDLK